MQNSSRVIDFLLNENQYGFSENCLCLCRITVVDMHVETVRLVSVKKKDVSKERSLCFETKTLSCKISTQ